MDPDKRAIIRYGHEVRKLREEKGITQSTLARRVNTSKSTISDVERGKGNPSSRLRADLNEALGQGQLDRIWDELTGSGREAWKYEVAELIDGASAVYEYQVLVFPAHLQTEQYAYTIIRHGAPWLPAEEVAEMAAERAKRAKRLAESARPMIWLVLDETILSRRYGSSAVMHGQLAYITGLVERERISVQLVPTGAPRHPGVSGAFKLITTDHVPDVLFAESVREGQLVTNAVEVAQYRMLFAALQGVATSPEETLTRLRDEIKRLEDD